MHRKLGRGLWAIGWEVSVRDFSVGCLDHRPQPVVSEDVLHHAISLVNHLWKQENLVSSHRLGPQSIVAGLKHTRFCFVFVLKNAFRTKVKHTQKNNNKLDAFKQNKKKHIWYGYLHYGNATHEQLKQWNWKGGFVSKSFVVWNISHMAIKCDVWLPWQLQQFITVSAEQTSCGRTALWNKWSFFPFLLSNQTDVFIWWLWGNVHISACVCAHICACVNMCVCTHMCVCVCVHICACVHCVCVCVCVIMYVSVCVHVHGQKPQWSTTKMSMTDARYSYLQYKFVHSL